MHYFLSLILTILVSSISFSQELSLSAEDFGKKPEIYGLKLSPDGNKLLMFQRVGEETYIVTRDLNNKNLKPYGIPLGEANKGGTNWGSHIEYSWAGWANNDTVITSVFEVIYNSKNERYQRRRIAYVLVDWKGETYQRIESNKVVENTLPEDPDHILLRDGGIVHILNIHTLEEKLLFKGPLYASDYRLDGEGVLRYSQGGGKSIWAKGLFNKAYFRKSEADEWFDFYENKLTLGTGKLKEEFLDKLFTFAGFTSDPEVIYIIDHDENKRRSIFKYNVYEDRKLEKIASHDLYDIRSVRVNNNNEIELYFYSGTYPQMIGVSNKGKRIERIFKKNFPNSSLSIESVSNDESKMIVRTIAPNDPGTYYFLDLNENRMEMLGYILQGLDVEKLSEVKPVKYKARDGMEIYGYMTLPKNNKSTSNLPTVIMPVDEFSERYYWEFNKWAQFIASKGYTVLQVNSRGANGYGLDYNTAGFFELGGKILDDINDGTKWMIKNGYSDPDNICIAGSNYGGYAALQSSIKEKGLYKCVIAYDPIIDFKEHVNSLDSNYIEKRGMDLASMSPTNQYREINAPILLFRRKNGYCFKREYELFVKRLKRVDADVEYQMQLDPEVNAEPIFFKEVEKFLDKHLKN